MTELPSLNPGDFADIFKAIHGYSPYAWQIRLLREVVEDGNWPTAIAAPTGAGKTAVLDVAVFHLALSAEEKPRKAPMRIVLAVDRRIIVDQAYQRACHISEGLHNALNQNGPLGRMATRLASISNDSLLHVAELRGGMPLEAEWARRSDQPTILCTTVDQLGSRLLFRGYGVSNGMAPIHAGLLGNDALLILDEAHLSHAFEETLESISNHRRACESLNLPWIYTTLTATPRQNNSKLFELSGEERGEYAIKRRLSAEKIIDIPPPSGKIQAEGFAKHARILADQLAGRRESAPVIAVVVNRVLLAREIWEILDCEENAEAILLTGRVRPIERDNLLREWRERLEGGCKEDARPLYVVATQCIEAGADFDFDAMVSQLAPLDALRQRFGRLARSGNHNGQPAPGVILAAKEEIREKTEDPVYQKSSVKTWNWLEKTAFDKTKRKIGKIDFGPDAFDNLLKEFPPGDECLSPTASAAPLRRADIRALAMTAPRPKPDPDPVLFLHGEFRDGAEVSLVWRADLNALFSEARQRDGTSNTNTRRDAAERSISNVLSILPPRTGEALRLPLWQVKKWLSAERNEAAPTQALADVSCNAHHYSDMNSGSEQVVMRWRGVNDSKIIHSSEISPGDVIVLPTTEGGCDEFGWTPEDNKDVKDVADLAARPYQHQSAGLRLHPDLWSTYETNIEWKDMVELLEDNLSARDIAEACEKFSNWVEAPALKLEYPYGDDPASGAILFAPKGLPNAERNPSIEATATTEADEGLSGKSPILLNAHAQAVADQAEQYAKRLNLSTSLSNTLRLAGAWHDSGKADPRFQDFLSILSGLPEGGQPVAKSGQRTNIRHTQKARLQSRLPKPWRHEVTSVRYAIARLSEKVNDDIDPDLLLWLIGTHHGHGRPFFHHDDGTWDEHPQTLIDTEIPPFPGPDKLDFDWRGMDWTELMQSLQRRYGWWGLAFIEGCLRLADHRASAEEEK